MTLRYGTILASAISNLLIWLTIDFSNWRRYVTCFVTYRGGVNRVGFSAAVPFSGNRSTYRGISTLYFISWFVGAKGRKLKHDDVVVINNNNCRSGCR